MGEPENLKRYGFIYAKYRNNAHSKFFCWSFSLNQWELAENAKKTLVVAASILLSENGQAQAAMMMVVIFGAAIAQYVYWPFEDGDIIEQERIIKDQDKIINDPQKTQEEKVKAAEKKGEAEEKKEDAKENQQKHGKGLEKLVEITLLWM